jgi:hypothetical protein
MNHCPISARSASVISVMPGTPIEADKVREFGGREAPRLLPFPLAFSDCPLQPLAGLGNRLVFQMAASRGTQAWVDATCTSTAG